MTLRESLRPYVQTINQQSVERGWPMMRPMFFEFPQDPGCAPATPPHPPLNVEAQFMFGSDWLVAPVTADNATTWPAYLPTLGSGEVWEYFWNQTVVRGGGWVHVDVSNMTEFPLFRRTTTE